ncbi:MAG: hypothetical protein JWR53_968 [Glaciihabitans sp.]|nr:hypothetical protein [Glaciihabitans sp.]
MTSTEAQPKTYCYRHPQRESYVSCQRCGRIICPECQTQAAVGVHCPECVKEARASAPKVKSTVAMAFSRSSSAPVVTYVLSAIVAVLSLLTLLPKIDAYLFNTLALGAGGFLDRPWTAVTNVLINFGGPLNIAIAVFVIFWFGRMFESFVGRIRFILFVVLTALGGSAAVILLNGGAGAGTVTLTTGLLVAIFLVGRHLGSDNWYLLLFAGINLVFNFASGGGWQSIVGGIVASAVTAVIFTQTRRLSRRRLQIVLLTALGLVLVALCVVGSFTVTYA